MSNYETWNQAARVAYLTNRAVKCSEFGYYTEQKANNGADFASVYLVASNEKQSSFVNNSGVFHLLPSRESAESCIEAYAGMTAALMEVADVGAAATIYCMDKGVVDKVHDTLRYGVNHAKRDRKKAKVRELEDALSEVVEQGIPFTVEFVNINKKTSKTINRLVDQERTGRKLHDKN